MPMKAKAILKTAYVTLGRYYKPSLIPVRVTEQRLKITRAAKDFKQTDMITKRMFC